MSIEIAKWNQIDGIKVGHYCFPFEIEMPDWLPASLIIAESKFSLIQKVQYMLVIQLEGNSKYKLFGDLPPSSDSM